MLLGATFIGLRAPLTHPTTNDRENIPIGWIRWRPLGKLSIDQGGDLVFPPVTADPLDLADKAFRSGLERRLIPQLCETGIEVLNRNGNPSWKRRL
jgi:hypothetical protein